MIYTGVNTEYKVNGKTFQGYIRCTNNEEALRIKQVRLLFGGVLETITSDIHEIEPFPIETYLNVDDETFINNLPTLIHYVTYVSWIALRVGVVPLDFIMGDFGVLHELVHLLTKTNPGLTSTDIKEVKEKIRHLFDVTPGA